MFQCFSFLTNMEQFTPLKLKSRKFLSNHQSPSKPTIENKLGYSINNKQITYNNRTMQYYIKTRQFHIDSILDIDVDPEIIFNFPDQWDAYTGERICKDPFGSLCFHPASLVYHFYIHRLDGLWKDRVITHDEIVEGYYDMLVGSDLEITGRGKYPELYLFRLPILDCYLTPEHNNYIVTIGPVLSDQEIDQLEQLCHHSKVKKFYQDNFDRNIPSIKRIKYLYDNAISKQCKLPENYSGLKKYLVPQHYYVDQLKCL